MKIFLTIFIILIILGIISLLIIKHILYSLYKNMNPEIKSGDYPKEKRPY